MKWLLFIFMSGTAYCATNTAVSVDRADVLAAIALSSDGDTVLIPSGSAHYTTNMTFNKAIWLIGAGTNSTIIYDDIPNGSDSLGDLSSIIQISTVSNSNYRLSGICFPSNTVRSAVLGVAKIQITGSGKAIRIDHCLFESNPQLRSRDITWNNYSLGVVDHCSFWAGANLSFIHNTWKDKLFGDGSWQDDDSFGTTNTVVVEDCDFHGVSSTTGVTDCYDGGRYCVRHCFLEDCHLDSHEGGSRTRATRQIEVYNNTGLAHDSNGLLLSQRGGSSVIFSNTMTGFANLAGLYNYRSIVYYPTWGGASGTNIWDQNSGILASGTFNGANGDTTVLTDTNKAWTVNQWIGCTVQQDATWATNINGHFYGLITANTATTLTTRANALGAQMTWTNGDPYAIYWTTNTLDQPGEGKDTVIFSLADPPTPAQWPNQTLTPCYEWNNTPSNLKFFAYENVRTNQHYYDGLAKPGYTPLIYPHPLVTAQDGGATNNSVFAPLFSGSGSFFLR
jgi:hypothetical protein